MLCGDIYVVIIHEKVSADRGFGATIFFLILVGWILKYHMKPFISPVSVVFSFSHEKE